MCKLTLRLLLLTTLHAEKPVYHLVLNKRKWEEMHGSGQVTTCDSLWLSPTPHLYGSHHLLNAIISPQLPSAATYWGFPCTSTPPA